MLLTLSLRLGVSRLAEETPWGKILSYHLLFKDPRGERNTKNKRCKAMEGDVLARALQRRFLADPELM